MTDKKAKVTGKNQVTMSLYDINKQLYAKAPKATDLVINEGFASLGAWFSTHWKSTYFMLLCRERTDITIFTFTDMNYEYAKGQVRGTAEDRGEILGIQYNHANDAYEIWVKIEGEAFLYYFFDCQDFVVEV